MTDPRCGGCGAPWRSTVEGTCGYCGGFGRPPEAGPAPRAGELDVQALVMALVGACSDESYPLDGLAGALGRALPPERFSVSERGGHVRSCRILVADRTFDVTADGANIVASDVQRVRGVVLRSQDLDLAGLIVELAQCLAVTAGSDPKARAALAALPSH